MLRGLVLLLVLANLAFFAWTQGWLDDVAGVRATGDREPERLARQVRPESITILTPAALRAASAAAAAASAAAGPTVTCLEAGPFQTGASVSAIAALQQAQPPLPAGSWAEVRIDRPGAYIVFLGRFPNRDALAARQEELRRMRIAAEEVQGAGELQPGLSLGRFDQRALADRALEQLVQRGVRAARVVELSAPGQVHMLRVERADKALAAQLAALRSPALGRGFVPCGS